MAGIMKLADKGFKTVIILNMFKDIKEKMNLVREQIVVQ